MAATDEAVAALRAGLWIPARVMFQAEVDETGDPVAAEGLAQAAWWLDDGDVCVSARMDAYATYRSRHDDLGAGRAATSLAWDSMLFGAGRPVGLGWLAKAERLLAPLPEAEEHAWLAIRAAECALFVQGAPTEALHLGEQASQVAQRTGSVDPEIVGLAIQGLASVRLGDVNEGMALLDEAVAGATAGDVTDLMWIGKVCCWLIVACQATRDFERAADWCLRVEALCRARDLAPLFNVCSIAHASVQIERGAWTEAEQELTDAAVRLSHSRRESRVDAVVQLGELRRRQGRIAEAEQLLDQAEFHPRAQLSRIEIQLTRGLVAEAASSTSEVLAATSPDDRLTRVDVLIVTVRAALACGQQAVARAAAEELRAVADAVGTDPLLAAAARAEGLVAEPPFALTLLREAVRRYAAAGLPYEGGWSRLDLARALLEHGDRAGAEEQAAAATTAFRDLDAIGGLAEAARLGRGSADSGVLTERQVEVLRLVAQGASDREIADSLVISEHTVHRHVSNILVRLDARSGPPQSPPPRKRD